MTVLHKAGLAALVATCPLAFAPANAEQTPSDSAPPTISVPPNLTSGPSEEAVTSAERHSPRQAATKPARQSDQYPVSK